MIKKSCISGLFFKIGKYIFLNNSLILFNKQKNDYKVAKIGYSFTMLISIIIGFWLVPFFRKDYKTLIYLILCMITIVLIQKLNFFVDYNIITLLFFMFFLIFAFFYNKIYFKQIISKEYSIFSLDYLLNRNDIYKVTNKNLSSLIEKNNQIDPMLENSLINKMYKRLFITIFVYVMYTALIVICLNIVMKSNSL